jgi:hypothetical protein
MQVKELANPLRKSVTITQALPRAHYTVIRRLWFFFGITEVFERSFTAAATMAHRATVVVFTIEEMEALAVFIVCITLVRFFGVGISNFCVFSADDVRGHLFFLTNGY